MDNSKFIVIMNKQIMALSDEQAIEFGLNICQRLLPDYIIFSKNNNWGKPETLKEAINYCQATNAIKNADLEKLQEFLSLLEPEIPDTDDFGDYDGSYALNASASVCELLQFYIDNDKSHFIDISRFMTDTIDLKIDEFEGEFTDKQLEHHSKIIQERNYQIELTKDKYRTTNLFVKFLNMAKKLLNILILLIGLMKLSNAQKPFKDVTKQVGINHQFQVYEGMFGGGACVLDFDNDGFEDVFLTGGMNDDMLYKNMKNGTFSNIYEKSGLIISKKFVTQGATAADVNRDGFVDLFVTTVTTKGKKLPVPRAMNLLFLNNGNGTFRDATKEYKLDQLISFSTAASFGDFNADGFPDLYVGNYFNDFKGELTVINDATIVGATQTSKGYLLLNKGGKYFENVYENYGLNHKGFGFGGVFTDYDNDGDQDLIINHDFGYKRTPNLLLENKGWRKKFVDVGVEIKMDLKINSMATAVGDYNNDGLMDYYFTNIRFNHFMVNQGLGKPFIDKTQDVGLMNFAISWGANFADFDNDGDVDLYVSNGDLNPNCVPMADFYFENDKGHFQEKASFVGLNDYGIGRGSVVFDYDKDGDLDVLIVNQKATLGYPVESFTHLYRNDSPKRNWLKVALKGIQAESHGLGSKIEVVAGGKRMIREIDGGGSSHISQNSTIAHFGLGTATTIDSIIITWTGGKKQILTQQKINQLITITESPDSSIAVWIWLLGLIGLLFLGFSYWKAKIK